ncbi:MAG: hypothetical protein IJ719_20370 [Clostridia bacterium]|nr:hypothetical protein [Clostridia bacterium]
MPIAYAMVLSGSRYLTYGLANQQTQMYMQSREETMMDTVRNHLMDAGCPEETANIVERLYGDGRLGDALHPMRILSCGLMEELHQSQRKVDCLDHLIRQTEKTIKATKERR